MIEASLQELHWLRRVDLWQTLSRILKPQRVGVTHQEQRNELRKRVQARTILGVSILDKVNWRFHRVLNSCAHGDVEKIETYKLNFEDIMEQ